MVDRVLLKMQDEGGKIHGGFELRNLEASDRTGHRAPILDFRNDAQRDESTASVHILEAHEYFFEFYDLAVDGEISTDKPEFFNFDPSKRSGRLRPGLHTGLLKIEFFACGRSLGCVSLEVRSLKLEYQKHYRWMLRDLADAMAEIVMQRFAPTEQSFESDMGRDPMTLYQRFAFLKSLLLNETFQGSIQQILYRPHATWVVEEEFRRPGRGTRGSSSLARQLAKPGARIDWLNAPSVNLATLPRRIRTTRTESTLDNPPNRFVKFALLYWRAVVARIGDALEEARSNAPVERGILECQAVLNRLDRFLGHEIFRSVGNLTHFPASSQVLQKQAGYRDVFRAYMQFEAASKLSWEGGEDVYSAGQRDVAALYEYWVFLKVAMIVSQICHTPFDFAQLVKADGAELNIVLKRGRTQILSGFIKRADRLFGVELYFNASFSQKTDSQNRASTGSWTRQMRPDLSLRIFPKMNRNKMTADDLEDVWLHFDAKYRVDDINQIFGSKDEDSQSSNTSIEISPKRDDLLKMHAYRDAIRRSAGAYVIYPGALRDSNEGIEFHEYHEILPGLGAFPMRPTESGTPDGQHALNRFIDRVLTHLSSRLTRHQRGRFWTREAYGAATKKHSVITPAAWLETKPPADTLVLLGYVKNEAHLAWILEHGLYNLRADARRGQVLPGSKILAADLVLLYGDWMKTPRLQRVVDDPRVVTKEKMLEWNYPRPGSDVYFCLSVDNEMSDRWPEFANWSTQSVQAVLEELFNFTILGAPAIISALDLVQAHRRLTNI